MILNHWSYIDDRYKTIIVTVKNWLEQGSGNEPSLFLSLSGNGFDRGFPKSSWEARGGMKTYGGLKDG